MFKKELAVKMLKLIDEKEMTLETLAEASGLSRVFIGNIISGKQVPSLDSFEKICSALDTEPNYLLINEKSNNREKSTAKNVSNIYCSQNGNVYSYIPICPNCNALLKSEWQSYCDNCGQKLSWKNYRNSTVTLEKPTVFKA